MTLRPAVPADADVLRAWRNDALARAMSPEARHVGRAEHRAWFARNIGNIRIGVVDGRDVGVFRWSGDAGFNVVSVAVAPSWRGRGYGTRLVQLGTGELKSAHPHTPCRARVRLDNTASIRAFLAAGYVRDEASPDSGWIDLVRP